MDEIIKTFLDLSNSAGRDRSACEAKSDYLAGYAAGTQCAFNHAAELLKKYKSAQLHTAPNIAKGGMGDIEDNDVYTYGYDGSVR